MKKPILLTLFLLSFFCFIVKSQTISLGIRSGISIPNLSAGSGNENPLSTGYSSRLGPDEGLFAEFKFSNLFSLEPMIQYSSQGGKKNGLQAFTAPDAIVSMYPSGSAPQYLYANYNSEARMNYLMIPVLAKFGWDFKRSPLRIYLDAGPFAGFLISAKQVTSGESEFYTDPAGTQALPVGSQSFNATTNIKDQLYSANVGIEGNIGLSYRLRMSDIFIEGGGNYGFLNIQKNPADGKNQTGAGVVDIGYSHRLGK